MVVQSTRIAITLLDVIKEAIEVVHVESIDPVMMRVSWYSLADMGFDRQDAACIEDLEGALRRRRGLEIGTEV